MPTPKFPESEVDRQRELDSAHILDTPPEPEFDELTHAVAKQLNMPIALVSLVDRDRQWFKSRHGLDACETSRDVSFCGHVVADGEALIVNDALLDPRFADNPLVAAEPNVRFCAGFPLAQGRRDAAERRRRSHTRRSHYHQRTRHHPGGQPRPADHLWLFRWRGHWA